MNTQTIETKFSPKSLPLWAQRNPQVAFHAERNLSFRCSVYAAKTATEKRFVIREAQRMSK